MPNQSLPNSQTTANLNAMGLTDKAQEVLWVKRILEGSDRRNVFFENFTGPMGSGRPFIQQDDATKVDGNTIIIHTLAALGGPGVQGNGSNGATQRLGNEEKIRIGSFSFKIGRWWHGVAIDDVAREETVIGKQWDNLANRLLRDRLGLKKSNDLKKRLIHEALVLRFGCQNTTPSGRNVVRPNNKLTRESLLTTDVVSTPLITRSGLVARSNGARKARIGKSKSGHEFSRFTFFTNEFATPDLRNESAYLQARTHAAERGDGNTLFAGGFTDWDGHAIYEETIEDHDAYGPVGDACVPRAFLGTAILGRGSENTPGAIGGGGSTAAAAVIPAPLYFEFFSNAAYTFANGDAIAADTSTDRYAWILNPTNGYLTFINFRINSGSTLTIRKILGASASGDYVTTVGNVTATGWSGTEGTLSIPGKTLDRTYTVSEGAFPVGCLIQEANSYGVAFGYSFLLGEMAGVCGHGSLRGRSAMAARTEEHTNHNMDHAIGVETVWGCNTVKRTDDETPNYVLCEHALKVDGLPVVS